MNKNKLRGVSLLSLSIIFTLFSSSVFSIGISDEKYDENNDIFTNLEQQSNEERFDSLGTVITDSFCSGNWLGSKDGHAYILTAAHCLNGDNKETDSSSYGQQVSFRTGNGKLIASGLSTNYFNSYSGLSNVNCNDDIAVAKIPLHQDPVNADNETADQPIIADIEDNNAYKSKKLYFAGHGLRGTPNRKQILGLGRAYGEGFPAFILGKGCLTNTIGYRDSWAFTAPGDSGSINWQNWQGQFVGMGITSFWAGWEGRKSGHGLIHPSMEWLKRVAPMVKTLSSTRKVTPEHNVSIQHPEKHVTGSLYYLAGDNVKGPNEGNWERPNGDYTKLVVTVTNNKTGKNTTANIRAQRNSACGLGKINTAAYCANKDDKIILCEENDKRPACEKAENGGLNISVKLADNSHLEPNSLHTGNFTLQQLGWHNSDYSETMIFTVEFTTPKAKSKKIMACHWLSNKSWKWERVYYYNNEARCRYANRCGRGPCFQWREVKGEPSKPNTVNKPKPKPQACHARVLSRWIKTIRFSTEARCKAANERRCRRKDRTCYKWM